MDVWEDNFRVTATKKRGKVVEQIKTLAIHGNVNNKQLKTVKI